MTMQNPATSLARFEMLRRLLVLGSTLAIVAVMLFFLLTLAVTVPQMAKVAYEAQLRLVTAWAPVPVYLWAMWQARMLFARLPAEQQNGYPILAKGLVRIGLALSITAVMSGFIGFYLAISSTEGGNARFISAVVPQLALCLIGLALAAAGILLKRSCAVMAENAILKAKLEGFI